MSNRELAERSRASFGKIWKQALFALAALATLGVLLYSLTTAWYTNVAETTELVFETESWGFEGQVKALDTGLLLAPGQSACAALSVTNDGEQINQITVTVDKSSMPEELQKRIYFYVPAEAKESDKTADRVYLSTYGGYSYRVMPKSTLLLTADSAADAPVRCEWVYDVLGYYVYGTLDEKGQLITGREGVEAPVYIRPVEYDYDKAIFQDDKLLTVGEVKVDDFVQALLAKDAGKTKVGDYYAVNTTGTSGSEQTGLWLYLCTQTEIEKATVLDTRIGTYRYLLEQKDEQGNAIPLTEEQEYKDVAELLDGAKATIQIAGQNLRTSITDVTEAENLTAALEQGESVRLAGDMTLEDTVTIPADKDVIIDLNGKQLTTAVVGQPVLESTPGSSITVLNGTIDGGSRDTAVQLVGSSAAFSGVTIQGRLLIEDNNKSNEDGTVSVVRLSNCTLKTVGDEQVGVHVFGNGAASSSRTVLLVEDCTIESTFAGILGNGSDDCYGTDIQVLNSTVKGAYAGIYQPQRGSRLLVQNSTVEGMTGIAVKGGTVTIQNCIVNGTAEKGFLPTEDQVKASRNGWLDTGAGVYVEANYDWADEITLTITDSTITTKTEVVPNVLIVGEKADAVTANSNYSNTNTNTNANDQSSGIG
ncbi:MAG: hypothetical protein BHV94_06670 [Clostridiales bacterium 59_14]|nr:MAG: hypothetical protein BHV94_06670 [Clostridiales bacterium 59_14]